MQADVFSLVFECVQDGRFWPGTTGSEWTKPEGFDQKRIEKETGTRARANTNTHKLAHVVSHENTITPTRRSHGVGRETSL